MNISQKIGNFANSQQRIHFIFSRESLLSLDWSFRVYTSYSEYGDVILELMEYFDWLNISYAAAPSEIGFVIHDSLRIHLRKKNLKFIYLSEEFESIVELAGSIKTSGAQIQIVVGDATYVNSYISAAVQKNIVGEGRAILIIDSYPESINRSNPDTGLLALVEEGTENATNEVEYDVCIMKKIMK